MESGSLLAGNPVTQGKLGLFPQSISLCASRSCGLVPMDLLEEEPTYSHGQN